MNYQHLQVEQEDNILIVRLHRPEKLNAVNYLMFEELIDVSRKVKRDHTIRAVILTGSGDNFSSGLDFKSIMKQKSQAIKLLLKVWPGNANKAQQVSANWRGLSVPVIAAIDGYCWGAGLQIALGADFRIASSRANLSIMESKMGLTSDMAGSLTLREIMPKDQAMRLSMCATQLDAKTALHHGLITEINDKPLEAAIELSKQFAQTSPDAIAAIKHIYNRYWTAPRWKLLAYETYSQVRILVGKNFMQAQYALKKKALPMFKNRQRFW
ncbi:crotonase/enoyl-CoA hydratase family protein [Aliivibrio sp. S4TY2]|uniref:crotonase/enoyl-CoA hydratase family protein n=1 Tax=unclassified Aliivibrio TaxID=2645654 RepID=UPI002378ED66|nr:MULTISPECIES: crotonase/enoyl-CoA hydratase family protein [unclassified Aliivibrio]MDD9155320.1 crotonase/enoyl-CoA hydratase family protein [Aliivibrio sp. S4TY2]MDD9159128.1 crotonase/enoyl-CoA hydratase family protein [Aliivibrio sp. S4TY1]MDD9163322.1 crotonase/enoyl-CoA hydratase family protein [Aliivibrio sp. S4MY2]MDD9167127.1 crotonase/enoyl-CoA hydratase family protein [Aliivibrio sp. S4MY4]MDD9184399.1 crotonase/enoyl-CoA hydratase family protein [Aliivibrio sp. S4MY3]